MADLISTWLQVLTEHPGTNFCKHQCLGRAAGVSISAGLDLMTQFTQKACAGLWGKLQVNQAGPCSLCRQPIPTIGKPQANVMGAA